MSALDILDRSSAYESQTTALVALYGVLLGIGLLMFMYYAYKWFMLPGEGEDVDQKTQQISDETKMGLAMCIMTMGIILLLLLGELEWMGYDVVFNNGVRRTITRFVFLGVTMFTFYRATDLMYRAIQAPKLKHLANNSLFPDFISLFTLRLTCVFNGLVLTISVVVFFAAMLFYTGAPTLETEWAPSMVIVDGVAFLWNLIITISLIAIQLFNIDPKPASLSFYLLALGVEVLIGAALATMIALVGFMGSSYDPNLYRFQALGADYQGQSFRVSIEVVIIAWVFCVRDGYRAAFVPHVL